jgi:putative SOS response-associated peptidase YedK
VGFQENHLFGIPKHEGFACRQMNWGWRVPWDKKPLINAKSETITHLPTFKPHLHNRYLILADGFYEKGIRFIQPGEMLFAMAGLWQPDAASDRHDADHHAQRQCFAVSPPDAVHPAGGTTRRMTRR